MEKKNNAEANALTPIGKNERKSWISMAFFASWNLRMRTFIFGRCVVGGSNAGMACDYFWYVRICDCRGRHVNFGYDGL